MSSNTPKTGAVATPARDQRYQPHTQKITTFLWFDNNAEEAANFYVSVFKNSRILNAARYGDLGPGPKGTIMIVDFELDGERFTALNGGPNFKFTEAVSLVVHCKTQEEVDYFWEKLSDGGEKVECGWLKDKFGLSWQIIPTALGRMLNDADPARAGRVMNAMLQMNKLDIGQLQHAYDGQ